MKTLMEALIKTQNELTSLQNFADSFALTVKKDFTQDKRKKQRYILVKNNTSICQPFTYNEMNIFLLGIMRCKNFHI